MEKKQYIRSERAHFMCPNMHFGIKATIKAEYNLEKIKQSLNHLEENHPFLKSILSKEESSGLYYYSYQDDIHIELICKENPNDWENYYKECTRNGWNVRKESLLKVIVMPKEENFVCLFVAHHLLGDGRAILGIMEEFADVYVAGKKRKMVQERLIESINDLPK